MNKKLLVEVYYTGEIEKSLLAEKGFDGPVGPMTDFRFQPFISNNEECQCKDCGKMVKRKDGAEWRWYDFYAPQGDEAPFICFACRALPKHLARVARDDADRRAEFGDDPEPDDSGDWNAGPDEDDDPNWWRCTCCGASVGDEDAGCSHPDYPANICTPCGVEKATPKQ